MGLEINKTDALIGIRRIAGKLEIKTEHARVELHQKHAKVNIDTELPRVEIDQYECFASAGLKNYRDLTKEAAQRGLQQAMEYIGKIASDGDRLAAIEQGGSPIADIAERDAYPVHEFGLDFIPKARPKITLKEGSVNIAPERNGEGIHNGVEANVIPGHVNINYTPTKINIYLRQKASISFSYRGNKINTQV